MIWKPWSMETFPKDRPVYVKPKAISAGLGATLIVGFGYAGVVILAPTKETKNQARLQTMTWTDLFARCEQQNGKPCGRQQ